MIRTLFLTLCGVFAAVGLSASNPLLTSSDAPYGAPRLDRVRAADLLPAIEQGISEYQTELEKIRAVNPAEATFENVVVPLEKADRTLALPRAVVNYLKSNFGSDAVVSVAEQAAPLMSAARDGEMLDSTIFGLVQAVYDRRHEAGLDSLQRRVLDRCYRNYVRSGARCTPEQKERLREINREISLKSLRFGQNLVRATEEYVLYVQDSNMLAGIPQATRRRFAQNAVRRGQSGMWAIGFTGSDYATALALAQAGSLREMLYKAYVSRCSSGPYDNRQLAVDLVNLRLERSQLLGYGTYTDYVLETNMARDSAQVYDLLMPLVRAATAKSRGERDTLEAFAARYERNSALRLEPWDVSYYSDKLRRERFGSIQSVMRRYLVLDNVLRDGVFYVAERLYGITFTQRTDIPVYHPEVLTFEARDADRTPLGVVYLDCFARRNKRRGAWCSRLRGYSREGERETLPLITVSCNFNRAAPGRPQLLSPAEVRTLFHEFGHALAGLCARGPYAWVTGNFPRDMVELPSQLNEHWAWEPEVMKHYARDYETGRPISYARIEKLHEMMNFQNGMSRTNFYAATLLDLEWHTTRRRIEGNDTEGFERAFLARYGFPEYTSPNYRTCFFNHIFASSYPSQYYSYTWSAVLDTDAFAAFAGTGDIFDVETARRYRRHILTRIGWDDPMVQYVRFRGAAPDARPLMRRYGFAE